MQPGVMRPGCYAKIQMPLMVPAVVSRYCGPLRCLFFLNVAHMHYAYADAAVPGEKELNIVLNICSNFKEYWQTLFFFFFFF